LFKNWHKKSVRNTSIATFNINKTFIAISFSEMQCNVAYKRIIRQKKAEKLVFVRDLLVQIALRLLIKKLSTLF